MTRLGRKWSYAGVGLFLFAFLFIAPLAWNYRRGVSFDPEKPGQSVNNLLTVAIEDDRMLRSRNSVFSSHLLQITPIPASYWQSRYPVLYAREILISQGTSIVPHLLKIIDGPPSDKEEWWMAFSVLQQFDDPRYLKALVQAANAGKVRWDVVASWLVPYLPVRSKCPYLQSNVIIPWLDEQLATCSYGDVLLALCDDMWENPGRIEFDSRLVRWFDWYGGHLLDEWLAAKAPEALAFRHRELKKGYDPAVAFGNVFALGLREGKIDEGINAVFQNPDDRRGCRLLMEVLYDDLSPIHPKEKGGWLESFKFWYKENRPYLVYDERLHRFRLRGSESREEES